MSYSPTDLKASFSNSLSDAWTRLNTFSRREENTIPALHLSPGIAIILLFAASIGIIVFYSFLDQAPPQGNYQFTLRHYKEVLTNDLYLQVLWDSLVIAVESTVIALLVSYPVAYYLSFTESDHQNILLLLILLPFWMNLVIRTYAWRLVLGSQGVINYILVDLLGLLSNPINLLFTQVSIIIGLIHVFLPYMILPIYVSLDQIDRDHIEAAQNLGANNLQAFYEVTLPQSVPGVAAGVVLSFVLGFGAYLVPLLLGGIKHIMIANIIGRLFIDLFNWGLGSAVAVCVTVFVLAFVYVFNSIVGLEGLYGEGGGAT
jgi:spermidine/putrescine transport system permease protein